VVSMVATLEIPTLMNGWSGDVPSCGSTKLSNDIDISVMADCCSAALGFGGVTHRDSDSEPTGSASSGINEKRSHVKDDLGGVTPWG
jgi:hypothetical protein